MMVFALAFECLAILPQGIWIEYVCELENLIMYGFGPCSSLTFKHIV